MANYTFAPIAPPSGNLNIALNVRQSPANFAPHAIYTDTQSTGGNFNRPDFTNFGLFNTPSEGVLDPTLKNSLCYITTGDTGSDRNPRFYDPSHVSKTRRDGPYTYHVYDAPGSYDIRAYQYDIDGNWGVSDPQTITVVSPDDYFTDAQTIVVAPDGDFTGAPHEATLPAANKVTTLNDARLRYRSIDSLGNVRITIKRDSNIDAVDVENAFRIDECAGIVVFTDAWGMGADPVIDISNTRYVNDSSLFRNEGVAKVEFRMAGIKIKGNWQSQYATPNAPSGPAPAIEYDQTVMKTSNAGTAAQRFTVLHNVTFEGFQTVWVHNPNNTAEVSDDVRFHMVVSDTKFEHNGDYMIIGGGTDAALAFVGTQQEPHINQETGSQGRHAVAPENYAGHSHNATRGRWAIVYQTGCNLVTNHGWSGDLALEHRVAAQQPLRLSNLNRLRVCLTKNLYESGSMEAFGVRGSGDDDGHLINGYFAKNYCCFSPGHVNGAAIVVAPKPTSVIRNNVFLRPNTPAMDPAIQTTRNFERFTGATKTHGGDGTVPFRAFTIADKYYTGGPADPAEPTAPIVFDHNILIQLQTAANGALDGSQLYAVDGGGSGGAHVLEDTNNVVYAPNLATPINPGFSLDATSLGFDSTMGGLSWNWELSKSTQTDLAPGSNVLIPYPLDWYGDPLAAADFAQTYGRTTLRLRSTFRMILTTGDTPQAGQTLSRSATSDTSTIRRAVDNGDGTWTLTLDADMGANQDSGTYSTPTVTGATLTTGQTAKYGLTSTAIIGCTMTEYSKANVTGLTADDMVYDAMTVAFEAGGFRLTNTSDLLWLADDWEVTMDRGEGIMVRDEITRVPAGTLARYDPASVLEAVSGDTALDDIRDQLRPAHPDFTPGKSNSKGPWMV